MPSDVFQWKKSSHTVSSVGAGMKLALINRDIKNTRDYTQQLLHPEIHDKLESAFLCYANHFDCANGEPETVKNQKHIRGLVDDLYDRAKNELLDKYIDNEQSIVASERLRLEQELCAMQPKLNGIAGSTRNCFTQSLIARTLNENSIEISSLLAKLRHDAITKESEALNDAIDRSLLAYIEADEKDYQKMLGVMQLLRGTWNKIDYTDDTDDDVRDFTVTGQWNRTAGSIADAADVYKGDQDAINAAGAAFG